MPPGTWYVPMAQMQKHWVQAMLNEDTYTPFPYFYDVTAWSQPLLFNVHGGYSGGPLDVNARGVDELDAAAGRSRPRSSRGSRCSQLVRGLHLGDRVERLAALPARAGLEGRLHDVTRRRDRRRRPRPSRRPAWSPNGVPRTSRLADLGPAGRQALRRLGQRRRPSDRLAWRHRVRRAARPEHGDARATRPPTCPAPCSGCGSTATARCTPASATRPTPSTSTTR